MSFLSFSRFCKDRYNNGRSETVRFALGFGVAALALALATPAAHAQFGTNLLVNGDAESGPGRTDGGLVASIPGWVATGQATVTRYGFNDFPTALDPGPANRGLNFFSGGPSGDLATLTQSISLAFASSQIDNGAADFSLSGWFGGYATQGDHATLTISFLNAGSQSVGSPVTIGPVSNTERDNVTGLLFRSTTGTIPTGARSATATISLFRNAGSYNDGYTDNLSFSVTQGTGAAAPEPGALSLLMPIGITLGSGLAGRRLRRRK